MPIFQSFESKLEKLESDVRALWRFMRRSHSVNEKHVKEGMKLEHWRMMEEQDPNRHIKDFRRVANDLKARHNLLATPGTGVFKHKLHERNNKRLLRVNKSLYDAKDYIKVWEAQRQNWKKKYG